MLPETDESAVQADAYIDALLAGHRRVPMAVESDEGRFGPLSRQPGVRGAIRVLERGLPRFHPSFQFEEWLAGQLRDAAGGEGPTPTSGGRGEIIPIAVIHRPASATGRLPDRRLLVGGAIASSVSIAGAAVIYWRRSRN